MNRCEYQPCLGQYLNPLVDHELFPVLSKIAFAYYPTDPNASSNPFVTSWWPRALSDPALFHVSLQTASLDEELMAQKGFPNSQILMADSISLLRNKVGVSSLAAQDETMNAVVTLAAIEVSGPFLEVAAACVESGAHHHCFPSTARQGQHRY